MTPPKMDPRGLVSRGIMITWMAKYGSDMARVSSRTNLTAHGAHALYHAGELPAGDEPGRLRKPAIRRDVYALRLDVLQHQPQPLRHQLRRLDPRILHVHQ